MLNWLRRRITSTPAKKQALSIIDVLSAAQPDYADVIKAAEQRTFIRTIKADRNPVVGSGMDANDSAEAPPVFNFQGFGMPAAQVAWFSSWGFIGYQMCAMLAQHWLIDKACKMPADDAVRNGYELGSQDKKVSDDTLKKIKMLDTKYNLEDHLVDFVHFGRVFGIRLVKFDIDMGSDELNAEFYANPFNIEAVKPNSYRAMVQIDPTWISPELSGDGAANPESPHFYDPEWWIINNRRIHRSHFVIFRNGKVADTLKATYFYGGIPLPQKLANRVYAAERTADEAPLLALAKRATVLKVNMEAALQKPQEFAKKMQTWTSFVSNWGVKILGQKDEIEQFDTALADMDALIMTQYQLVAATAGVPSVKLLGTSPKGFGASGEYEEANYHEELKSIQANKMSALINKHHEIMIRSDLPSNEWFTPSHTWNALDSTTSKGIAENNKLKSETGTNLVNSGAISPDEERSRIATDKNSGYAGLVKSDAPDDAEDEDGDETQEVE